jgi:soluble lytic murein transglycosylase
MKNFFAVPTLIIFFSALAFCQPLDQLSNYRALANSGQNDEAVKTLQTLFSSEQNPAVKAKVALALGVINYKDSKKDLAFDFFKQSLNLKTRLDDYANFYLGLIERDRKNWDEAKKYFLLVQSHTPKSVKAVVADTELARLAKAQERWPQAYLLLNKLERKYRGSSEYPTILFELTEISSALKKHSEVCRFASKLYSRFPEFALSKGWGADFFQVKVRDSLINCPLNNKDREKRLAGLILAGEFDEVRSELKSWFVSLKADRKSKPEEFGRVETEYGQLALGEGKVKEAIDHFQTAQTFTPKNFSTQMFLARAYSLTDNYGRAVEGYLKAFDLSPHSKLGQKALFQAAFLSYQNRDYDGAERHFSDAVRFMRGKLAWDSKWHLAWIRYLKADYDGSLKDFTVLSHDKKFAKGVDLEKINYWRGMSQYRLQHFDEAEKIFTPLAAEKRLGYYSGAATARLKLLVPATFLGPASSASPAATPSRTPAPNNPSSAVNRSGFPDANSFSNLLSRRPASLESSSSTASPSASSSPEHTSNNEESLIPEKEVEKLDEEKVEEQSAESLADAPPITSLKNDALTERFERARDLIDIGLSSWAQNELREIERRTTNRSYLQTLMTEYHKAGDYFRSATIADLVFESQREKDGVEGAQSLWQYAFPQAFSKTVQQTAKKFDVPSSLVWGVMRGESGYREEIHSSAGAIGLMQMIPPTAKKVAKDLGISDVKNIELTNPETNILFGVRYLKRLNKTMGNNLPLTIASYNAGPHRVQGWLKDFGNLDMDEFIEHIPYLETRNYVKKVLRNYLVYETLYSKKSSNVLGWLAMRPTIKFEGPKPLAESWDDQP